MVEKMENSDMKQISIQTIMEYLEKYNDPFAGNDVRELSFVIRGVLKYLKEMPENYKKIKGSYSLNSYEAMNYELFYIVDMVLFKRLLKEKKYDAFIHELYDFLKWKIMKGNQLEEPQYLPVNIKNALIETIEHTREEI